jgi:hypothetical protein
MSRSCGDRAACACVCIRHGCVSTACRVCCVVELHGVCCDPSGAASASCASWGRPKLADRAAEWGSVSSCSRSAALAIKTPCTHRCRSGQEKYKRQRVCAAAFGRNSCLGYCLSSSSSVCCVRLSVRALLRADDRSQQEPTVEQEPMVDPSKSRRLILARADGRSQQLVSKQDSSGSRCRCRRRDGVRWRQWRRGRRAVCRPVRGC